METPWDDCKVALGVDSPEVYEKICFGHPALPKNWDAIEVDSVGARTVIIFRVEGIPTVEDGNAVRALLDSLK